MYVFSVHQSHFGLESFRAASQTLEVGRETGIEGLENQSHEDFQSCRNNE
jgi:hypothetical protein